MPRERPTPTFPVFRRTVLAVPDTREGPLPSPMRVRGCWRRLPTRLRASPSVEGGRATCRLKLLATRAQSTTLSILLANELPACAGAGRTSPWMKYCE